MEYGSSLLNHRLASAANAAAVVIRRFVGILFLLPLATLMLRLAMQFVPASFVRPTRLGWQRNPNRLNELNVFHVSYFNRTPSVCQ
jgi:hypothetical protein